MPNWPMWIEREQAGKLSAQEQSMLNAARRQGLAPAAAPAEPTSETREPSQPQSIDPMTGLRMPSSPEQTEETFRGMAERGAPLARTGAALAIGTAGPAAGAALGGSIAGPPGALAGEMAGGYGARKLNVALGLEEPGMVGDIMAGALPPAAKLAGSVVRGVARRLPGVGTAMQDVGMGEARGLVESLVPTPKSDTLYAKVAQMNPAMTLHETGSAAKSLLAKEGTLPKELQSATIRDTSSALDEISGAGTDFQTLWLAQRRVRDLMRASHGEERNALGQLDSAIWKDIDAAAASGTPDAGLLRAANKTYRKERAIDDLRDIVEGSITEAVQGQGTGRINAGAMLRKFDAKVRARDDLFAGSFTDAERESIRGILKDLSTIPVMGPVAGQMFGSGMSAGLGGVTFAGSGGDPVMTGLAVAMPWVLSGALASAPGRALVRGLMRSERLMTPEGMSTLRGFLRTSGQLAAGGTE